MNEHQYILEPYKGMNTRYHCPGCRYRDKTFVRYIDTLTGEYIDPTVGRCNREINCGYHYTPKQYFKDHNITFDTPQPKTITETKTITPQQESVSSIPVEKFKDSLKDYESNHFVKFLIDLFGVEVTNELISKYFIGTSKHWNGATVFWQIDIAGRIRTGKIMLYSPVTGKRTKEPFNHIAWVHKALKQAEFKLKQCLFGEHLLQDMTKPIAIVESEKTAIVSSIYLPNFIWIATGGLANLTVEKCQVFKGRRVVLYPDLGAFDKWKEKINELSHLADIHISDLFEYHANQIEKKEGLDLADYLLRFKPEEFQGSPPLQAKKYNLIIPDTEITEIKILAPNINPYRAIRKSKNWDKDINELKEFFKAIPLPSGPYRLSNCETITNVPLFIENHLEIVRAQNGKPCYRPYLDRLNKLKLLLSSN